MNLIEKELKIKQFRVEANSFFSHVNLDVQEINLIYDLYFNNKKYKINSSHSSNLFLYYGNYYKSRQNFEKMIKYYQKAIKKNNSSAMNNLALYYEQRWEFDDMTKYYLMAIENDNISSMYNLGLYYKWQRNFVDMRKYFLMAIEKGHLKAMNRLGDYYKETKDYENMMQYYLMAIKKGNSMAMNNLGIYYKEQKDYENILKYHLMACEKDEFSLEHFISIDKKIIIEYLLKLNDNKRNNNKIIKKLKGNIRQLTYKPDGPGYIKTKNHFDLLI